MKSFRVGNINGNRQFFIHESELLSHEAELALSLIRSYGLVAAKDPSAEKPVLQTPEEVVTRACSIARVAFENFRMLGWIVEMPPE